MDFEEALSRMEGVGGSDASNFLYTIAKNEIISGMNFIKQVCGCDDDVARKVWDELYKKYSDPNTNSYVDVVKAENTPSPDPRIPHCPYCGSTSIQAVRRNWSFMRGFATNKIDRVCLNCGKKL